MATLVLTTVGALVGGPVGAAIGAAVGNQIDQRLFAPRGRQGPRLDDLTVQSSAYGVPIARLYGTIRATGNIIWSSGLKETAHRSGGGKRSGGRTTTYSYSASFAVLLSARPIVRVDRIWADGKLLRGASGELTAEGRLRIHSGGESQQPDPLIIAAEGAANAPAYRGLAYAVFEDLQLGDFANRIPNLAFEVVADETAPTVGAIAGDLAQAAHEAAEIGGLASTVAGFAAARDAPLSTWIEALSVVTPVRVDAAGKRLRFHDVAVELPVVLSERSIVADSRDVRSAEVRGAESAAASMVTIGFADPQRDYMAGLQRAFRPVAGQREEHVELPVAMQASDAKRLAQQLLQRRWWQRATAKRRLGYRLSTLAPGDRLTLEDGRRWEIRRASFEGMAVELELEAVHATTPAAVLADAGRAEREPDLPQGETRFELFEAPPLAGELSSMPRLWVAAAGTGAGWRRAEVWLSADAGATWTSLGLAGSVGALGATVTALPAASPSFRDPGSVDVALIADAMWLESRSELSVLAGANLALIGDELIQFASAVAIAPRLFRLSGLLRGRRASAVGAHPAGARFTLVDPATLFAIDLPTEAIGGSVLVRLVAPNTPFADAPTQAHRVAAEALRPLAPVHLSGRALASGDVEIEWLRSSRAGFGWIDGADAPLGETSEAYRVRCTVGAAQITVETAEPRLRLTVAEQTAAFGTLPGSIDVAVAQLSATVGAGRAASRGIILYR
jgi:hypothetical protein